MSQKVREGLQRGELVVDSVVCHGCQSCMVACSLVHEGQVIPSLARIQVVLDPFSGSHLIRYCHQCAKAPCAQSCPRGAIQWVEEGGYWAIDDALCDGCGACVEACPFGAMVLDRVTNRALKCDTCQGEPACVASCPREALAWKGEG